MSLTLVLFSFPLPYFGLWEEASMLYEATDKPKPSEILWPGLWHQWPQKQKPQAIATFDAEGPITAWRGTLAFSHGLSLGWGGIPLHRIPLSKKEKDPSWAEISLWTLPLLSSLAFSLLKNLPSSS